MPLYINLLHSLHLESIKVLFNPNLGVVDFHPSAECAVMFISPAEMVEGNLYRKRLAGLRAVLLNIIQSFYINFYKLIIFFIFR